MKTSNLCTLLVTALLIAVAVFPVMPSDAAHESPATLGADSLCDGKTTTHCPWSNDSEKDCRFLYKNFRG